MENCTLVDEEPIGECIKSGTMQSTIASKVIRTDDDVILKYAKQIKFNQ